MIGYARSDGNVWCNECGSSDMLDDNTESGYVTPIFAGQEVDAYDTCYSCGTELEDESLTSEGVERLHEYGRKLWYETYSDIFPDDFKQFFDAYFNGKNWYCLDCFCSEVLQGDSKLIKQFREKPEDSPYLVDCISETSKQFDQFPLESFPNGVFCHGCGSTLYEPFENEE